LGDTVRRVLGDEDFRFRKHSLPEIEVKKIESDRLDFNERLDALGRVERVTTGEKQEYVHNPILTKEK
jgi:hypothetical protein